MDPDELPITANRTIRMGTSSRMPSMRYATARIQNPAYPRPGAGPGGGVTQYCGAPYPPWGGGPYAPCGAGQSGGGGGGGGTCATVSARAWTASPGQRANGLRRAP